MRGRKPKPPALRLVGETEIDVGGEPSEHLPTRRLPTCPAHLSPSAKAEWKRLAAELYDLRILSRLDRAALAAYCQAYGRWVEAERKLRETPMLLKIPSGYVQQNPWLTIANKQLELMHRFITDLGLSPVSRGRISPHSQVRPDFDDDPDGDFD